MGAFTYFKTKFFEWQEERRVRYHLYSHAGFKKADQTLLKAYRGQNPYRISIQYLKGQNASDIYTYGETPLSTMAQIAHYFGIGPEDRVIEMGAGRGRAALFLAEYIGCQVRGYELIPTFVEKFPPSPRIEMLAEDMFQAEFSWATVIFLYGTMLETAEIEALVEKFPKGAKILTVSYSLSEYSPKYQTKKTFLGLFPWGETEIYWNERTCQ